MYSKSLLLLIAALVGSETGGAQAAALDRRMFDFTPISKTNPVVASIGDSIQIPLSEYGAFVTAEKQSAIKDGGLDQKKAVLDDLVGEYLLVDEAYKDGVAKRTDFLRRMTYTRTILLSEFLVEQEVDAKAKTADEYNRLLGDLRNRVFDEAEIDVSNEAYEKLKQAAREINATDLGSVQPDPRMAEHKKESAAKMHAIVENLNDSVLARYEDETVKVKEVLAIYCGQPAPRPPLEKNEDLIAVLRPLVMPTLLAAEAKRKHLESLTAFQNKLDQNRNALLRMYAHGVLQQQASDGMKVPDIAAQMESWFKKNAERYAVKGTNGTTIPPYSEVRERVEGDYSVDLWERLQAEKIRSLRSSCRIVTNEELLKAYKFSPPPVVVGAQN